MGKPDTSAFFAKGTKFHVIEYGMIDHQPITWRHVQATVMSFNPGTVLLHLVGH